MYSHQHEFPPTIWQNARKIVNTSYFPVFAQVRIHALHVLAQNKFPKNLFLHVLILCWGGAVEEGPESNKSYEAQRDCP